ncbi:MAG: ATP synthase F0 subunit B [bacterium]|nr:ATP synthase F0 subunit B [bacterium]
MESLVHNLGLDWKLLLSQAVNFLILLTVLRFALYKPLMQMMAKRKERIEQGLEKAKEADRRLEEVSIVQKEKMKETQAQAIALIRKAEEDAKLEEKKILAAAAVKETEVLKRAEERAKAETQAAFLKVRGEAVTLVKQILVETVKLKPEAVDEALIRRVAENNKLPA